MKKLKWNWNLTEEQKTKVAAINAQNKKPEFTVMDALSKTRVLTYASIIFLPPYGLYRVWEPKSDFRYSEKLVWTMIAVVYLSQFIKLMITG